MAGCREAGNHVTVRHITRGGLEAEAVGGEAETGGQWAAGGVS